MWDLGRDLGHKYDVIKWRAVEWSLPNRLYCLLGYWVVLFQKQMLLSECRCGESKNDSAKPKL
jgi:hypothetical protein